METISPALYSLDRMLKCKTVVSASAEDAMELECECTSEAWVYSDGSGLGGKAGAVVVLYREGTSPRVLRYSLGTLVQHTTYEAEAVGLLLALHFL